LVVAAAATEITGGNSSVSEASFNFINSIVGAGLIGIPFALKEAGLGMGLILLVLMGWVTDYSITLLVRTGVENKRLAYGELVTHLLGSKGYVCLTFAQFFFPVCGMIAYVM
jgi:sodium-coupled neutral amino acid transporter 11